MLNINKNTKYTKNTKNAKNTKNKNIYIVNKDLEQIYNNLEQTFLQAIVLQTYLYIIYIRICL